MKTHTLALSFLLTIPCYAALAATPENVLVLSTQKVTGSLSVGAETVYTKTFDVTVANLSGKDIDLSTMCLKAYSQEKYEFKLDTVGGVLARGIVKAGQSVKSTAVFAAQDDAVYQATLVKITDECP
ncbi:conserved hypothetical protein; putative exported protein (plasmid) [Rahnella aceris]|uniref:DUF4354 family protein n=1 Tax=Rahnella sp. (strain Y9602) TaxID=2703885 RepID=A0A0H3FIT5_RAHSY|nr:DUF4354 family protein [Rahnella aceris]ADW76670.1 conserved hypothetical protein; putative exported protein [Rahnella aceris]